jgi:hypothetical protein
MKIVVLLIVVSLCHVILALPGGWTNLTLEEVNSDAEVQASLQHGINYVINKGVSSGKIPDSTYNITEIVSARKQVVNGINYEFHVKLSNDDGVKVDATFVVHCKNGKRRVMSWDYDFKIQDTDCFAQDPNDVNYSDDEESTENCETGEEEAIIIPAEYSVVSLDTIEDDEQIQWMLDFGADFVVNTAVNDHKVPDHVFEITDVYRVWKKEGNSTKHKFHVSLSDHNGTYLYAIFTVLPRGDKSLVTCYKYTVWVDTKDGSKKMPAKEEEDKVEPTATEEECEEEEEEEQAPPVVIVTEEEEDCHCEDRRR